MNKVCISTLWAMFTLIIVSAQNNSIFVYDFATQTLDSIPLTDFDPELTEGTTPHNIGNFNTNVALLSELPPSENVYEESQFTYKKPIVSEYDVMTYPIRTTVKIWDVSDGSNSSICTGTMISKRHVLTGAFCALSIGTNEIYVDSLSICPVYTNGEINENFDCVGVSKVYFIKDWTLEEGASAILELADPIGEETGWVGIGYSDSQEVFENGLFYRFSYPSVSFPELDPNEYNGDTLYYGYGLLNNFQPNFVGVSGAFGIPGEDGCSIIKVDYNNEYVSYGTLTWSTATKHAKLNIWSFQSFQNIIEDDVNLGIEDESVSQTIVLWPNPVTDIIYIEGIDVREILDVAVFDGAGKEISSKPMSLGSTGTMDVSHLPSGLYFININSKNGVNTTKFVKI